MATSRSSFTHSFRRVDRPTTLISKAQTFRQGLRLQSTDFVLSPDIPMTNHFVVQYRRRDQRFRGHQSGKVRLKLFYNDFWRQNVLSHTLFLSDSLSMSTPKIGWTSSWLAPHLMNLKWDLEDTRWLHHRFQTGVHITCKVISSLEDDLQEVRSVLIGGQHLWEILTWVYVVRIVFRSLSAQARQWEDGIFRT